MARSAAGACLSGAKLSSVPSQRSASLAAMFFVSPSASDMKCGCFTPKCLTQGCKCSAVVAAPSPSGLKQTAIAKLMV